MNMSQLEINSQLDHKYILFDTNIFIKAAKHFDTFEIIFRELKRLSCPITYFPLIEFEFTRDASITKKRKEREEFFEKIAALPMPIEKTLIDEALAISKVYSFNKISIDQISLVDCIIAAYVKHYHASLFLMTTNHKDFPLILFDRIQTFALDAGAEVLVPAIYKFNNEKWTERLNNYQQHS